MDTEAQHPEDKEQERLDSLLKRCRARITPERPSLGPYLRLPMRIGKPITQEEVAEAVGISRQWYAMLESDRAVRVSAAVLGRIADALMMPAPERAALFRLALPELRSGLANRSTEVLEAFGSVRCLMRRLWAATTEAEALTIAQEAAMAQIAPDVTMTATRVGAGQWVHTHTDQNSGARVDRVFALLCERLGAAAVDDVYCYSLLPQPGDLVTRSEQETRFPDLAENAWRPVLDTVGWSDVSFAFATVRSQRGFVARLTVIHNEPHAYSKVERAQLSTLADVASLALSGCVSSPRRDGG